MKEVKILDLLLNYDESSNEQKLSALLNAGYKIENTSVVERSNGFMHIIYTLVKTSKGK